MTKPYVALSLGWGVQSWALAAMSALGKLPPIDAAIHADTTHERSETYAFAERWTPWLQERGVNVVTIAEGRPLVGTIPSGEPYTSIPCFTTYADGRPSGMLRRQCTKEWKIYPIRRYIQAHRNGRPVEQWLGITLDEVQRMRPSDVQYITNRYPFIELLDRPWTRLMAMQWLQEHDLEIPVKSSCVFCAYHDRATWREIQQTAPNDWEKAIEIDRAIRHNRPGYICYLTRPRIPLEDLDLRNQEDHGQLTLWDEECEGMCFL